jgi:hypothetical protein
MALGFGKMYLDGRKLKKIERAEEAKEARTGRMRQGSYGRRSTNDGDIPFGSRCIEKGVEVEGIWISRPNSMVEPNASTATSPYATPPDSPFAMTALHHPSYRGSRNSSMPDVTRMDVAETLHGKEASRASNSVSDALDQLVEAERMPRRPRSHVNGYSYKPRQSSQLRYSSYASFADETLNQLEDVNSIETIENHRPVR